MQHPAEDDGFTKSNAQNDESWQNQQSLEASFKKREKFSKDS